MEKNRAEFKEIVIVGGGICGLATALALHRKGIRSTVLEKSEKLRAEGVAIILQPNGWRALDQLGVASVARQTAIPIQSASHINICSGKQQEVQIGGELRCLRRDVLLKVLADSLPRDTVCLGRKVVSVEINKSTSNPVLKLHNGTLIMAKIVIGCDGLNSTIAKKIGMHAVKQLAMCVVRGFRNYECGHQFGNRFVIFSNYHVQFGYLPVTRNLVYWFITRKFTSQDSMLMVSGDPLLLKETSMGSVRGFPYHVEEMIKNSATESLHLTNINYRAPWDLLKIIRMKQFLGGMRVTLAGDAMHAMSPFLAQGGSASLEDAVVLARCIAHCHNTETTGDALVEGHNHHHHHEDIALCCYAKQRKMRVFWLSLQTYLIGITLDPSSNKLHKFLSALLLIVLFRDPTGHTQYDCGFL